MIEQAGRTRRPSGRWALKDGAEPKIAGFWVSLTTALVCGVGTLATGDHMIIGQDRPAWSLS
jgi:hypothetical protein